MKTYEQVLATVELSLLKGEYHFCIEFLSPIINSFPLSSKEGVKLRTILITALCGVNKKKEASKICKELLKSYDYKTRENAKYLMEIIDSPEIKKPDNWNINFESNSSQNKKSFNSYKPKNQKIEKNFINVKNTNNPTGETKPFQKGFTIIISLILLLLIPLLSGCVKIENTLDLSELDSINNYLQIKSKYINKLPWQIKFEEEIKDIFPYAEISTEKSDFSLKNKNLNLKNHEKYLREIQQTAADLYGTTTDLKIETTEKNFIFFRKYNYRIDLDLQNIPEIDDLEINFKIINQSKVTLTNLNNLRLKVSKNTILWNLTPGKLNTMEFSFWRNNNLLIGTTFISLIIMIAYLLRFYRFKIGSDLPQLPSS